MTHTLHRHGSYESLRNEFIVLTFGDTYLLAKQRAWLQTKFPSLYQLLERIAIGIRVLRLFQALRSLRHKGTPKVNILLNSKEDLCSYLKRTKHIHSKKSVAKSVVVSGIFEDVNACLHEVGLCPHTVQFSLGHFGRTELLPSAKVLEVTTMCGHHMISPRFVEALVEDVGKGKTTPEAAARTMGSLCSCGIFNEVRAAKIISDLAK